MERTDERLRYDQPNGAFRSAEAQRDRRRDGRHSKRCSVRHVTGASYYEAHTRRDSLHAFAFATDCKGAVNEVE